MVEGTPLLREHTPKKCIEGSNPSLSASCNVDTEGRLRHGGQSDSHVGWLYIVVTIP